MSKPVAGQLDRGISFPVRLLQKHHIETCQSCEGGKGHGYKEPTIDIIARRDDADGFRALSILQTFGIDVDTVAIVWPVYNGLPYEKLWRITLKRSYPEFWKREVT